MLPNNTIFYIAGHNGMVGAAICSQLQRLGYENLVTRSHAQLDLCNQADVRAFMQEERPDYVVLAAAKVGGIFANNQYPAEFIYENLLIEANVIHQAYATGVKGLLFLGSSCIYPKFAAQPMREEELLTGILEPTNEPYALAKISGIKLCESYNRQYGTDYRSVMPTNLYGEGDNFHAENSHVIPALMRRFHEAKLNNDAVVTVWGSGQPMREFLHVDDMANACLHVMNLTSEAYQEHTQPRLSHINVGTGTDVTIRELAETMARVVGFQGRIEFDASKPDGTPRKLLDVSRLAALGWSYSIALEPGLASTYQWFLTHQGQFRG